MKRFLICSLLLVTGWLNAQSTTVTGNVTDPLGNIWLNSRISATFAPTPGQQGPYTWSGGPLNLGPITTLTDASGNFSFSLPSNTSIVPSLSTWAFTVCPDATLACVVFNIPITGGTQNITSTITANFGTAKVAATFIAKAYNNNMLGTIPLNEGAMIYNTTLAALQYWNGSIWQTLATGNAGCTSNCVVTNPINGQTITQPVNTNFNVVTSGTGAFQHNGNPIIDSVPAGNQSITNPTGTYTTMNAPSLVSAFMTTNANAGQILRAWGNSQTAGFGLPDCPNLTCTSVFAWPSVLAQKMGWTVDNQAVSSTECAQLTTTGQTESMWDLGAMTVTDASRNIYAHFRNEQANYGPLPYRVDYARGCIQAQTVWLAIPEFSSNTNNPAKFRANNIPAFVGVTGTWTTVGEPNAASRSTAQAGATMSFNLIGSTLYIAAARIQGSTATYSISVDSGPPVFDPITQSTTFSQSLDTADAQMPYLIRIPNLTNGHHTLVYTCVSPGTGVCRVFYAAAAQTDNATANGPIVYSLSPVNNADPQATGNMSFPVTQLYLNEWQRIISEANADGLQVVGLDATSPNVYLALAQAQADGIHPTVAGQQSIANGMTYKATLATLPKDRGVKNTQHRWSLWRVWRWSFSIPFWCRLN